MIKMVLGCALQATAALGPLRTAPVTIPLRCHTHWSHVGPRLHLYPRPSSAAPPLSLVDLLVPPCTRVLYSAQCTVTLRRTSHAKLKVMLKRMDASVRSSPADPGGPWGGVRALRAAAGQVRVRALVSGGQGWVPCRQGTGMRFALQAAADAMPQVNPAKAWHAAHWCRSAACKGLPFTPA